LNTTLPTEKAGMNEFDILKECLPLADNLPKFLCVKTKINYFSDFEFRLNTNLSQTVRKFGHSGWIELQPLVIGIKCYLNDPVDQAFVDISFADRENHNRHYIDTATLENEVWHAFKYPLLEAYHTETRIQLSPNISAYTLAILNCSEYVRYKHNTNTFPGDLYKSYEGMYSSTNKTLIYVDKAGKELNPNEGRNYDSFRINSIT
jgi:hypothetical protein